MAHFETPQELADQIADWLGIYSACKQSTEDENGNVQECDGNSLFCCRQGFVVEIEQRIRDSVENEKMIEKLNLQQFTKNSNDSISNNSRWFSWNFIATKFRFFRIIKK